MRHPFLLLLLVTLLTACGAPTEDATSSDAPQNMVLLDVASDPTVTFIVTFDVGSQDDPEGQRGLANLTATLIAEGATTENSWDAILEKLYPMSSSYQARVGKETTTLFGRTHRDNLEAFFGLFTDAYLRPAFTAEDFERLRDRQKNQLEKTLRYESDEELGKAALTSLVYRGTSYEHPEIGYASDLDSLTLDDVQAFYREHYTRESATLALAGGFPEDLVERFNSSLELLGEGTAEGDSPASPPVPEPEAIEGFEVLLVDKPGADASISFGFPISVLRGDPDFYALWIANSWLGEHRNSSSHLYQVIREERGMNYGDYSYIESFPQGGFRQMPPTNVARRSQLFEVWIRTLPNEQAHFAMRAALRELTELVEDGMSEEEFQLTRSFLSKYVLHFAPTTSERLGYALDDRFYGIDGEGHLARFQEKMKSITREEVNAALKKHLQVENIKIAIVTGEAEALKESLVSGAPSPINYPTEKSARILEEDQVIAAFPFPVAEDAVEIVPVDQIFQD